LTRKSPVRHKVKSHTREGSRVNSYVRGHGKPKPIVTKRKLQKQVNSSSLDKKYKDWKKGDKIVVVKNGKIVREAVLQNDAKYFSTGRMGGFSGTLKFDDGEVRSNVLLNMMFYYRMKNPNQKRNLNVSEEILDESKAGPDYRAKAKVFRKAGMIKEAKALEKIAEQEDQHKKVLSNIQRKIQEQAEQRKNHVPTKGEKKVMNFYTKWERHIKGSLKK
jgi:hypothetical protein